MPFIVKLRVSFNPSTLRGDYHGTSPYNTHTLSCKQVLRKFQLIREKLLKLSGSLKHHLVYSAPAAKTLKQMLQNCSSFLCSIEKHYHKPQKILNRNSSKWVKQLYCSQGKQQTIMIHIARWHVTTYHLFFQVLLTFPKHAQLQETMAPCVFPV